MPRIFHDADAPLEPIAEARLAVIGYGNQGRSWALNLREIGYSRQTALHSQTSQYGTLSRAERFADLDVGPRMRRILEEIRSGAFAREWAAERRAGYPRLTELRAADERELIAAFDQELREKLRPPKDE